MDAHKNTIRGSTTISKGEWHTPPTESAKSCIAEPPVEINKRKNKNNNNDKNNDKNNKKKEE